MAYPFADGPPGPPGPPPETPDAASWDTDGLQALDLVPAQICLIDRDGFIRFTNRGWTAFARENGYNGQGFIGQNYLNICAAASGVETEAAASFGRRLRTLLAGQGERQFSICYPCHAPDAKRWFKASACAMTGGAIVTHTDITEEYERLEAESRVLTTAGVIHDLRSPLNAIIGFANLISRMEPAPTPETLPAAPVVEYVGHIGQAGTRMLDLVNDLLDYTGELRRNDSANETDIAIAPLLNEVLTQTAPAARQRKVRLECRISGPLTVWGDERALWKLLVNLVSNAVKYNRPHGVVTVFAETNPSGGLEITVQDNGVGMAPERLGEMFRPFTRSEAAQRNLPLEGSGIGLALVREIVHRHDGVIRASAAENVGAAITVVLPSWRSGRG